MPRKFNEYHKTLEERFWAKVWRCSHRWPCKKCCWPWRAILLNPKKKSLHHIWQTHGFFYDPRLLPTHTMGAYRVAYMLEKGALLFPGLAICHRCHFAPCCNPSHLFLGTVIDNIHDNRRKTNKTGYRCNTIFLPNGRMLHSKKIVQDARAMTVPRKFSSSPVERTLWA